MTFIDTHTHLYSPEFDEDRTEVVRRAREAGAELLLLPNVDEASIGPMLRLCAEHPGFCRPMMGLQPEEIPENPAPLLDRMEQRLRAGGYAAVGEVGIDLYWDRSRCALQTEVFRRQAGWAVRYGLPLVIHCRNAHREVMSVLRPLASQLRAGGVFHCFGGTIDEAQEILALPDFYLGIGGVVTFKKSTLPAVLHAAVPLERIVLETDAPYLTPVPHRGKRNEPAYLPHVIAKLADLYECSPEDVARITTANARRLFP